MDNWNWIAKGISVLSVKTFDGLRTGTMILLERLREQQKEPWNGDIDHGSHGMLLWTKRLQKRL